MGDSATKPDFAGWATKNDLLCADGATIRHGAFAHMDKVKVPLVWMHDHKNPESVLGHVWLENRAEGTYATAYFNATPKAKAAKEQVLHGDINMMSIWANNLKRRGGDVLHGDIKEVSLVLAGANSGAVIEEIYIRHADGELDEDLTEAIIHTGIALDINVEEIAHADAAQATDSADGQTVLDIIEGLDDVEKAAVLQVVNDAYAAGAASTADTVQHSDDEQTEDAVDSEDTTDETNDEGDTPDESADDDSADDNIQHNQEGDSMTTHNIFEGTANTVAATPKFTLSHSDMKAIVADGIKNGSFKNALADFMAHSETLQHAGVAGVDYGIEDIDVLFPDAKLSSASPELLARQAEWVPMVLNATKHQPFAKVKTVVADLTAEQARAKGYIKGNEKKEEVLSLLKRTTGPTTIYKKQKLDRDDILDITDFDVVVWLKWEIRFMLNEEIGRAILVGDGRSAGDDDKIKDPAGANDGVGIRSIANDHALFAHPISLESNITADDQIEEITRGRQFYRGSGSPSFYTTDKIITEMLLLKDKMGRRLYDTEAALASALRVKEIVAVEVMEETPELVGIVVNLVDYTIGANKGGELTFFEDFDIDFNQNKYLLETRISGALTKPKSALVFRRALGTAATPTAPSYDGATNTITIPTVTGITYYILDVAVTGNVVINEDTTVTAEANTGYYIPAGTNHDWSFDV